MATATLPTIQNNSSPVDNLINSVIKGAGGSGTQTTTGGFSDQLSLLLNNLVLGTGPYSRDQAIADSVGPARALAESTMSQYIPQQAAQTRGAGLYNSTTQKLLRDNADAQLATAMSALVTKNITDYANVGINATNAAANANRTNSTTKSGSGSSSLKDALTKAGLGLLAGEGKKFLGDLLSPTKSGGSSLDPIGDLISSRDFGSSASAAASSGSDPLGAFINSLGSGAIASDVGGGGIDNTVLGDDGLLGSLPNLGDIGNIGTGLTDFLGGLTDSLGGLLGNIGGGISDLFGGLFEEGGVVPVKKAPKDGDIKGPKSESGRDNMLIAVQGGEGILHTGVMAQPGMAEIVELLNKSYSR